MKTINRITIGMAVGVLYSSLPAWGHAAPGQNPAPTTVLEPQVVPPSQPLANDVTTASGDNLHRNADAEYRLGPGDLIEVSVFGVKDFRHTVRISASGVVQLPLIDTANAAGLTAAQLEQRLAELLARDVIKNPQVSVFVKEYRSQPIYVLGAVRAPGQYQITMQMRIVDAIAMAGGALPTAGDEVTIQRPLPDGGEQTIPIDLTKIVETGDLRQNLVVQGGDVINVRQRPIETIYVIGEVTRPGAFTKTPKQEVRVSQLLALAGGPVKTASLSKGMLVRYNEAGQRSEMPLNVKDILTGKAPDVFVQSNDIIFIPGSTVKSLGYGVLATVPGVLSSLPYSAIP